MKAVVFNLGCKVNQYESDVLIQELQKRGYDAGSQLGAADLYIINTCAVTAEAERKSRQAVGRCLAYNPDAKVYICGCAGELSPDSFVRENVEFVCGADKSALLARIESDERHYFPTLTAAGRTRAFAKVQDGCDNYCSYCIIPHLRGRSRSKSVAEVVSEVKSLAARSKEIVLTGINLALYGKDIGTDLPALIRALKDVEARLRLGSFYVEGITQELLEALFSLRSFCPHFHISLQSGDDGVLKAMNRRYTAADCMGKMALIRGFDANAAITADIIVGYPAESERQFENTEEFVRNASFSDIHIFPFSRREGTAAAALEPLDRSIIKRRAARLSRTKSYLQKKYLNANIGIIQNVLFEDGRAGLKSGYSERYIKVYAFTDKDAARIMPTEPYKDGLKGEEHG